MTKTNCANCSYGPYDPMSDVCDGCMNDPDTGWGGFTDGRVGKHFNSEEERDNYYENYFDDEDDEIEDNFEF